MGTKVTGEIFFLDGHWGRWLVVWGFLSPLHGCEYQAVPCDWTWGRPKTRGSSPAGAFTAGGCWGANEPLIGGMLVWLCLVTLQASIYLWILLFSAFYRHSFIFYLFLHLFIHSIIHSFIRSFIHSFKLDIFLFLIWLPQVMIPNWHNSMKTE